MNTIFEISNKSSKKISYTLPNAEWFMKKRRMIEGCGFENSWKQEVLKISSGDIWLH